MSILKSIIRSNYRHKSANIIFSMRITYPHPPVWCVLAHRRDLRADKAGRHRGDARSPDYGRAGTPAGDRKKRPRRKRAHRAARVPRRAVRGPDNGCGISLVKAADVRGVRGSRGRRTPKTQIWTDRSSLKCLIRSS